MLMYIVSRLLVAMVMACFGHRRGGVIKRAAVNTSDFHVENFITGLTTPRGIDVDPFTG